MPVIPETAAARRQKTVHSDRDGNVERLLDRLYDSRDMQERFSAMREIEKIGQPAVKSIVQRINQGGPWYFIRNMTLLLGRIGDENQLEALEPLVCHPDSRVQLEAVKSIQAINGQNAGPVLLKKIEEVDPELVGYIISVLGALRCREAGPYLVELLESKQPGLSRRVRDDIRAKACEALGRLGAQEAVPVLEKIVRKKGFIKGYPEHIRSAASKALVNISRG
ncbi:MAG: HEAT repeat domain-containing protein [Desulfosalsimonas sp.]